MLRLADIVHNFLNKLEETEAHLHNLFLLSALQPMETKSQSSTAASVTSVTNRLHTE